LAYPFVPLVASLGPGLLVGGNFLIGASTRAVFVAVFFLIFEV